MDKEIKQLESYIDEIVGLMEDTADNTRLIQEIQSEVKDIKENTTKNSDFKAEIENIKDLIAKVKTIKGDDGKDGKDGKDGVDGKDGKDGVNGQNGLDGKDGVDGLSGSSDTPKDIKEKLESLKKEKRLDVSAIKGIEKVVKENQTDWSAAINRVMLVATGSGSSTATGTVTGTGSTGTLPYWTSTSDLSYAPDHTMSVGAGRSTLSMAVWSGNPPLVFLNATGSTAMSQSDGISEGWSIGQGSSGFLNLNENGVQGITLNGDGTGYFKTSLQLGTPTTAVTNTDFIIGVSSNTNRGLVIQTKAGTTLPAFEIQDSAGIAKTRFDTTGNSAMRINYSGTMATANYAGFVLSVQNMNDAGEGSWIEILNGQAGEGAFFGMAGDKFQQFNWQGGEIEWWTGLTTSDATRYPRLTLSVDGNLGLDATAQYAWAHGWGGGKGVLALTNALTAPTTSLTTALAMYSVSGELWYMAPSNQARKVVTSTAALTSGRIPIVTTGGLLTDDADLTFSTDTLTATKIIGTTSVKVGTAAGYISSDGSTGWTGSIIIFDGKTIIVKDGIITNLEI